MPVVRLSCNRLALPYRKLLSLLVRLTLPLLLAEPVVAMHLGRLSASAETAASDGVGRLTCRAGDGRASVEEATGWIVGSADTVMTAAHLFYSRDNAIDPRGCVFRLYKADGTVRQAARIRYARSPWQQERYRNDSAHDFAVLKLDRAMAVGLVPAIAAGGRGTPTAVLLLSFPIGAADRLARRSAGEARPFPFGMARYGPNGIRISDPSRLFASSVDSDSGSSGAPYYSARGGSPIGLHLGYACAGAEGCINFGLKLDADMLAVIAAVSADRADDRALQLAEAGTTGPLRY